MAKETTKAPTGLSIARSGNTFTLSWKIADKDYNDGQHFRWTVNDTGKDKWTVEEIGKKATSKALPSGKFNKDLFYPRKSGVYLYEIKMGVKGNRKKYTTGSGKKKKTHKPGPSAWSDKTLTILPPPKPSLSVELDEELSNVCTFSWEATNDDSSAKIFTDVEWQSILVMDSNETSGSKLSWNVNALGWQTNIGSDGKGSGATGSKTITEDTSIIHQDGHSYRRWFRVRARGPRGVYNDDKSNGWVYKNHTYAIPWQAKDATTTVKETAAGYEVKVLWEAPDSTSHPIDKTTVRYAMVVPAAGLTLPSGVSWTDANISKDTQGNDGTVFYIDDKLTKDQCLFIQVNTQHDANIQYGVPTLAKIGFLKDPSNLSVQTNNTNHKATVTATNNSDVEDSFLVVTYVPSVGDPIDVGVIAHGSSSVTAQCPNWDQLDAIGFKVRAVVGSAQKQTRTDIVDSYSIMDKMHSENSISDGGSVPVAPDTVSVERTPIDGTVKVLWNWSWADANGAEISWSDHEDAWESTDEPDTYVLSNLYASQWNISGLETGKTWYIRVRLFSGNMSENENVTYGPYSKLEQGVIDLSSAPNKPVLVLSNPIISEDGSTTASWVYTTTDKTAQAYAEIAVVTAGDYSNIIAHALTAQHVTIDAETAEFESGNVYNLACRVQSASGKLSEWSDPVAVTIAEPLSCEISQISLSSEVISGGGDSVIDSVPYNFRITADDDDVGDQKLMENIVGGTVAWNQLVPTLDTFITEGGVTKTYSDGVATITSATARNGIYAPLNYQTGHKYLITCDLKSATEYSVVLGATSAAYVNKTIPADNQWHTIVGIKNSPLTGNKNAYIYATTTYENLQAKNYNIIDLTAMFGTTIADYIYSLEQSSAGAGVAWFRKFFPDDYYEYNAGELISVEGLESHNTVGFNQWDEEWELGWIHIDGSNRPASDIIRSKNYIPVIPNAKYYFNVPDSTDIVYFDSDKTAIGNMDKNNQGDISASSRIRTTHDECHYIRFWTRNQTTYNHDICINLSHNGSRNGEYEPYEKHSYELDANLTLRGILKLDASNNLYYDGDTYASDGNVTRKRKQLLIDGDTERITGAWGVSSNGYAVYKTVSDIKQEEPIRTTELISDKFILSDAGYQSMPLHSFGGASGAFTTVTFILPSTVTSVAEANAWFASNPTNIEYPVATPTTETADPYEELQEVLLHYGTEQFIDAAYEAGDRDVEIPVGHLSEYAPEGGSIRRSNVLTELPMTVTATGAGEGGITTVAIERAQSYHMDRPDEDIFNGFEGETVFMRSQTGSGQMAIDVDDLIGSVDDGASYRLIATVQDGFGQKAEAETEFEVHWSHQAIIPSATVVIDEEELIAKITPVAPQGAIASDRCDIYRLSADKPELIVRDAEFGTTYVDPYPTLGDLGGHRIVMKTKNDDYITEDNEKAWVDTPELGINPIENADDLSIIDFENRQLRFYYDNDYSSDWGKDMQETQYLGGSIQGDWNPAVDRTGSLSTLAITTLDQDMLQAVRRLAVYPGICHVRTADGSSYSADVQVSESRTHDDMEMLVTYSLSITRLDGQELDGMTLAQWEAEHPVEEEEEEE